MPITMKFLLALSLLFAGALAHAADAPYDIIIRNGHIIDGTGSPWYSGDIGIRNGTIAAIGFLGAAPAKRTIDAHGMVVAPGFIDMLGQSEMTILVNPHLPSKIFQGITTEFTGEGGSPRRSMTPSSKPTSSLTTISRSRRTGAPCASTFARLEKQGMGINLATYVGATQVRRMVLGDDNRAPNARRTRTDEGTGARRHA